MEVIKRRIENDFSKCDICDYDRGFHVSFQMKDTGFEVVLICPECGQRFRVGWVTSLV